MIRNLCESTSLIAAMYVNWVHYEHEIYISVNILA
jgi:hypothetical protein